MRVNPNPLPDLLSALEQTQQQINSDLQQLASGQSVSLPSDDPAAASMLVRNAAQTAAVDQFLRSIGSLQGEMQDADSALSSMVTSLQRVISLGVEGANGTLNGTDREAIADELKGIQSQLLSLANISYQGSYVFAGTATQTAPYVLDANSPSGVRYAGNNGVNQVTVGNQLSLQSNLPGSQLFSAPGHDLFQAMQDLIAGLQSGTGIDTAVAGIQSAYDHLTTQRVFYGNVVNQLNAQQNDLHTASIQLAQQQTALGGADMAAVISNLTTAQTSREATLAAMGRTAQANLFDYLK
jgi:flagellar hook-associated protein 3 FlgL